MRYFKRFNDDGELFMLLTYSIDPVITNPLITEITEDEYITLEAEFEARWEEESSASETKPYTDIGEG